MYVNIVELNFGMKRGQLSQESLKIQNLGYVVPMV